MEKEAISTAWNVTAFFRMHSIHFQSRKQKTCRQKPYEQTQQWLRNHIREQHSFPKKILV